MDHLFPVQDNISALLDLTAHECLVKGEHNECIILNRLLEAYWERCPYMTIEGHKEQHEFFKEATKMKRREFLELVESVCKIHEKEWLDEKDKWKKLRIHFILKIAKNMDKKDLIDNKSQ